MNCSDNPSVFLSHWGVVKFAITNLNSQEEMNRHLQYEAKNVFSNFLSKPGLSKATRKSSLFTCTTLDVCLQWTYPGVSPCTCPHLGSSLYSGWPHNVPLKSQASSSTSSLLSRWLNTGLHSHRGGGTVHLHSHKAYVTYCAAMRSSQSY